MQMVKRFLLAQKRHRSSLSSLPKFYCFWATTAAAAATFIATSTCAQGSATSSNFCSTSSGSSSTSLSNTSCSSDMSDSNKPQGTQESYVAGTSSVAFVTTPDVNSAKKLAHGLVERKLAACVNIIPQIQSIYMWEGKVNEDNEYLMMIKTRSSRLEELTKWIRENHPYSVAEVITLPIEQGNLPYLQWISQTVPEKEN